MSYRSRLVGLAVAAGCCWLLATAASAFGTVTPGWECVPTKAGKSVTSGGTGAAPVCKKNNTAVLAPTYVQAGVDGKPTVQFAAVNVQILNGNGSTASTNGEGNLVIGYDETPGTQSGSHNLVLGTTQTFSSYGGVIGGDSNTVTGPSSAVFGFANEASGSYSSALGGDYNFAAASFSSVLGGCENLAGPGSTLSGTCSTGAQAVLGGFENTASGLESTVSGGEVNDAGGGAASVAGGQFNSAAGGASAVAGGNSNTASGSFSSILGGFENQATTFEATVVGGETNIASAVGSTVLGGNGNNANTNCKAIPAAPGVC